MSDGNTNGSGRVGAEIRRFLNERRIEAALPPALRRQRLEKSGYERIGGLTNQNYKLFFGEQTLVLRLPGRGTGRFIDRAMERANHEAAAKAGFTPASLYFDERSGVKISHFIEDAEALDPEEARKPEICEAVALFLSRFHASGLHFEKEFNVFRMAQAYERLARSRRARFYKGYGEARARALALEPRLLALGRPLVACHNDLVPENILATPRGLTLIDWEYSGMNDPAWDLAAFLLESDYGEEQEGRFLTLYATGRPSDFLLTRVGAYKCLQDYLWALWSLLQETANLDQAKARYYRKYGELRYDRFLAGIGEVERSLSSTLHSVTAGGDE
jgi:thiamine kinase-like enzyme